ncbi:ammonium transporter AmtB-like domain-containing protein, partial [Mycena olivaceomarginata]
MATFLSITLTSMLPAAALRKRAICPGTPLPVVFGRSGPPAYPARYFAPSLYPAFSNSDVYPARSPQHSSVEPSAHLNTSDEPGPIRMNAHVSVIPPILAIGAVVECGRLWPLIFLVFAWSTLVYDPIACRTWNSNGWSFVLGGLDLRAAHPCTSPQARQRSRLACSSGSGRGGGVQDSPHNTSYVVLVTVFLWFGWFGSSASGPPSASAPRSRVTPASGFVGAPALVVFAFMAGTCCNLATQPKFISGYDDTLDVRVFCLSTFSGRFGGTIWLGRGRSLAGHPSVAVAVDVYAPLTRSTVPLLRDLGALHFGPVFVWP